jgi:hypothetical protein
MTGPYYCLQMLSFEPTTKFLSYLYRDFKKTSIANVFDIYWAWVGILVHDNKKDRNLGKTSTGITLRKTSIADFVNKYRDVIVSLSFFSNS